MPMSLPGVRGQCSTPYGQYFMRRKGERAGIWRSLGGVDSGCVSFPRETMLQRLVCYLAGILIGLSMAWAYGWAQHGGFTDRYRSADGTRCCGPNDCKAVPVSIVTQDGTTLQMLVMGIRVIVPAGSVHQSEDMQSYWCLNDPERPPASDNVRCLFYVIGS